MKNKGFTLVELLAVIVILAILVTIAVPSTISISKKINENLYCQKVSSIKNAASLYGEDRSDSFTESYNGYKSKTLVLQNLIDTGYLKKDQDTYPYILDPRDKTKSDMYENMKIIVYVKYDRIYIHFDGYDTDNTNDCVN